MATRPSEGGPAAPGAAFWFIVTVVATVLVLGNAWVTSQSLQRNWGTMLACVIVGVFLIIVGELQKKAARRDLKKASDALAQAQTKSKEKTSSWEPAGAIAVARDHLSPEDDEAREDQAQAQADLRRAKLVTAIGWVFASYSLLVGLFHIWRSG